MTSHKFRRAVMELSVIFPVKDEPESIGVAIAVLDALHSDNLEIVVVHEGEGDTTLPVLDKLLTKYTNLVSVANTGRILELQHFGVLEHLLLQFLDDLVQVIGCDAAVFGIRFRHARKTTASG